MVSFLPANLGSILASIKNKATPLKLLIVLIIIFGILLYVIDLSSLNLSQLKFALISTNDNPEETKWNWNFVDVLNRETQITHKSYFVNTDGCRMPSFNIVDENVDKFMFPVKTVHCGKPLTRSNENYLWICLNETEIQTEYKVNNVDDLYCEYEPFHRKSDFNNEFSKANRKIVFQFGDVVKVVDEFVRVICRINKKNKEIYRDYHFFILNKLLESEATNIESNDINIEDNDTSAKHKTDRKMNVMVIGLDSLSRLNFHRRMNESAEVLLNELNAVEFFGFNKVADNTYPNLIPTLTGLDENELVTACIPTKNHTFDLCHFIWNEFKNKNYSTTYVEDMASLGLFQYLRRGFKKQPTDYSLRPIMIEMEHNIAKHKSVNTHLCMGSRRTFDVLLEYVKKFIAFMTTQPNQAHFSFFWTTSYTHDYLNFPLLIDADFAQFLKLLRVSGALDNTFLVLMSDHGIRWGSYRSTYQGMMEERQPFLYFIPPKSFPDNYPEAMRNLLRNRRKLTTHFDLYETLRDLTSLETLKSHAIHLRAKELAETEPMPRGISLFLPISGTRTCYNAAITSHYCTCHEQVELSTTDTRVGSVARFIVNQLNAEIKINPECHRLHLNSIFSANLGASNTSFKNGTNQFVDITARIQTKPGLGEFEATVRIHDNDNFELTGTISRTNLYGKQSDCTDDFKLKLYCFCDSVM